MSVKMQIFDIFLLISLAQNGFKLGGPNSEIPLNKFTWNLWGDNYRCPGAFPCFMEVAEYARNPRRIRRPFFLVLSCIVACNLATFLVRATQKCSSSIAERCTSKRWRDFSRTVSTIYNECVFEDWLGECVNNEEEGRKRLWIWLPEDIWISAVFRRLDGKARVQESWANTSFSGWAARGEFMG